MIFEGRTQRQHHHWDPGPSSSGSRRNAGYPPNHGVCVSHSVTRSPATGTMPHGAYSGAHMAEGPPVPPQGRPVANGSRPERIEKPTFHHQLIRASHGQTLWLSEGSVLQEALGRQTSRTPDASRTWIRQGSFHAVSDKSDRTTFGGQHIKACTPTGMPSRSDTTPVLQSPSPIEHKGNPPVRQR